ncbi:ribosome maturation factor RimP [Humibacillus xanthopallidus]|uniref:Ribosome maturation factor RimP n=1 Tax=Humibacillus xanthopallidus TaxID=412689 RepID=A0A543HWD4_9MICO|nr:ribosome maturation factor RimP [Humibacillus xanthopallidus]TQM62673.1 ribosome maturation factor RimP [Humibacillus xanthopallidus]
MSTAQDLRATLEPVLVALGLVVEDLSVTPAGKRRLVRVLVDTDISGLDDTDTASAVSSLSLDDVAEATRAVSDALDESDVMGDAPYVLEVSSPGVGRRLTSRDQLRRQVGRLVEVAHAGSRDTGRLVEVGADALTLDVPATKKEPARTVTLELDAVEHAVVQVEFRRTGADDGAPDVDEAGSDEPATEGDI